MTERQSYDLFWGLILIGAGGVILADNIGLITLHLAWRTHWPLILIILGLGTVVRTFIKKDRG